MNARQKIFAFAFLVLPGVACGASLTAQDRETLAADSVKIGVCEQIAENCAEDAGAQRARCWREFDNCVAAYGIDGGRRGHP